MGVKDILFGKKKYFETPNLGIFETRARSGSTAKNKIWLSTIRIENYSDEIVILLDGDSFGPLKDQLDVADWVVKNLKTIDNDIINTINKKPDLATKYKDKNLAELRLACMNPWKVNSYELAYESKPDTDFSISVIIQDKKIIEID